MSASDWLLRKYDFIDHQENDPTGFSATLWQSKEQSSHYVLSIRGTDEPLQDTVIEDGLYVFRQGYARRQLVALTNYYNRLIAPEGSSVTQLRIIETAQPSARLPSVYDRLSGRYITLIETASATGLGAIPAGAGITLDVTGHSLGAHLTLGFSRLFPGAYSAATTFNAPGYEPVQEVDDFFRAIGGAAQFPLAGVTNLDGLEGPLATSIISDLRRRPKPGGRQFVFIEDQIDAALALQLPQLAFNHSQSLLTDSMGLYALFERVDSAAGIDRITDLLKAASNRSPQSLETALDGLRALFRVEGWSTSTPVSRREAYFANLFALDDMLAQSYPNGAGSLLLASEIDATVFAQRAKESAGLGYRYALRTLNPYVIAGADMLPAYAADSGSVALAATGDAAGGMTEAWIDRRSELLVRLAERNIADRTGQQNLEAHAADPVDYRWSGADGSAESMRFAFGLFAADDPRVRQVAFGSGRDDTLKGSNKDDSLFGESGNDTLIGLAGADHLEGGAGNDELVGGRGDDVLAGGLGFDTYVYAPSDGQDRIVDGDRRGRIVLDTDSGRIALGLLFAAEDAADVWRTADGSATLTHNSPWTLSFADGGSIVLGDLLESGDFSLTLEGAHESVDGYVTVTYEDNPFALEFETDDEREAYLEDYGARVAADTRYLGSDEPDEWYDPYGSNRVELGGGSDIAVLGDDEDIVVGGEGVDALLGGAGDDRLYGGEAIELEEAIASEEAPTGELGDMLADSAGDDWLIGGAGDDLISGGVGDDLLVGGAGDDHIYGDDYFPIALSLEAVPELDAPVLVAWSYLDELERQDVPRGTFLEASYRDSGAGGNDEIHGGAGDDWVNAGSGDDVVQGDAGDDYLVGGAGSDAIFGGEGNDILLADGIDPQVVYNDPDFLDGGAGDDLIVGNAGDNIIFGGTGNDEIYSGAGRDFVDGGDGDDVIETGDGSGHFHVAIVHGGVGNDSITAAGEIYGDEGDDEIAGSADGDRIYGGAGNDLLIPGGANSFFDGGEGDDVYSLGLEGEVNYITDASGFDTIELLSSELAGDPDFMIADSSLRLVIEDDAWVLYYGALGDRVVFMDDSQSIEQVRIVHEFAPGDIGVSVIPLSSLPVLAASSDENDLITPGAASAISVSAGEGDDVVVGTAGADELRGEAGNDTLIGGAGSDAYHFARGGGQDRIVDTGSDGDIDRVLLDGILPAEVLVFSADGLLFLRMADSGDEITIDWNPGSNTGIERVVFADAGEWGSTELLARAQALVVDAPLEVNPDPPADEGGSSDGDQPAGEGDTTDSGEPPAENTGSGGGGTEPEGDGDTVADGGSTGDTSADNGGSGVGEAGSDEGGSGDTVADGGSTGNPPEENTGTGEGEPGAGGGTTGDTVADGGSTGDPPADNTGADSDEPEGGIVADGGNSTAPSPENAAQNAAAGTGRDSGDTPSGSGPVADAGNATGSGDTTPDPAPGESAGSEGEDLADGGSTVDPSPGDLSDESSSPTPLADAPEAVEGDAADASNAFADRDTDADSPIETVAETTASREPPLVDEVVAPVMSTAPNSVTRASSTASNRSSIADVAPSPVLASSREPTPIEVFFTRVTPPAFSQQQWLDNWLPSGARGATARSESAAARNSASSSDAPSSLQTPAPSNAPADPEARNFTPDEIAQRYEDIDAWLALHDGSDPDELAGAGPSGFAGPVVGSGLWSGVASLDQGARAGISTGGLADLSGGALRPFQGLDEGFRRLT